MPSAGDVERYVYCARNWWLAKSGVNPTTPATRQGVEAHAAKGVALSEYRRRQKETNRAVAWAFRVLLGLATVATLILEVIYFQAQKEGLILAVTALVMVSAIIALSIIALVEHRQAQAARALVGQTTAPIIDSDLDGGGELLEDPAWGLSGRPDYILETDKGVVPVEVKTGKTPPRPHPSHIMQVASYMRLIEATSGKPPAYGLLSYPDRMFHVDWNEATQKKLKATLRKMAKAEASGGADRDHNHPGRCAGCSRRASCDQALA